MIHRLFGRDISAGTIDDIIDAGFFPWNFQRIGAGKYIDMLAIDINPGLITTRPILPKPLIPTLIAIFILLLNLSE